MHVKGVVLREEELCVLRTTLIAEERHPLFSARSEFPRDVLFSGEDKSFK